RSHVGEAGRSSARQASPPVERGAAIHRSRSSGSRRVRRGPGPSASVPDKQALRPAPPNRRAAISAPASRDRSLCPLHFLRFGVLFSAWVGVAASARSCSIDRVTSRPHAGYFVGAAKLTCFRRHDNAFPLNSGALVRFNSSGVRPRIAGAAAVPDDDLLPPAPCKRFEVDQGAVPSETAIGGGACKTPRRSRCSGKGSHRGPIS